MPCARLLPTQAEEPKSCFCLELPGLLCDPMRLERPLPNEMLDGWLTPAPAIEAALGGRR